MSIARYPTASGLWKAVSSMAAGVLLMSLGPWSPDAQAANPIGFHDEATCTLMRGWTCDPDNYGAQLGVHFYLDGPAGGGGSFIGGIAARVEREAAVGQVCGNGHRAHGFSAVPNGQIPNDGQWHTVYAYAINAPGTSGVNPLLSNSPKSVRCPQSTQTFYSQPSLTNPATIASRIVSHPTTGLSNGVTRVILWQQGPNADSTALSWAVGNYTGFFPPAPVSSYQYGINNAVLGSAAVQWYGTTIGMLNAPSTTPAVPGPGVIIPIALNHTFDLATTNHRPWPTATSELAYSVELQVPYSTLQNGSVNYAMPYLIFWDATTNKGFWYGMTAYDNRGGFTDFIMSEQCGQCNTGNPIVASAYTADRAYSHLAPGSAVSSASTWSGFRKFEYRVSPGELTQAVLGVRARFPAHANLSLNAADYKLYGVYLLSEIYYPAPGNGKMGLSFRNIKVQRRY